jgi:ribosomal protein S18 acetylase RimI-like enzyme
MHELTIAGDDRLVVVAEAGDGIVGFARARRLEPVPAEAASDAPAGWYLLGVEVLPPHRRRGVGAELTRARLHWIAERADEAFYFTAAGNHASIALHGRFGFREVGRGLEIPGADPAGRGSRVLYRLRFGRDAKAERPS